MSTVTVKYTGPPAQQVPLLAAHGHAGACTPDATYDVPAEIAERLVRSSRWFRIVKPAPVIPAESTRQLDKADFPANLTAAPTTPAPKRRRSRKAAVTPPAPEPAAPEVQAGDEEDTEQ